MDKLKVTDILNTTIKVDFNSHSDYETYPTADINCTECSTITSISLAHLKKHQFSEFSNLSTEDRVLFDEFINAKVKELHNSFLDYYCTSCSIPIRILYKSGAGGQHGEYGFKLKYLISGSK
jgi:hypothetical protein